MDYQHLQSQYGNNANGPNEDEQFELNILSAIGTLFNTFAKENVWNVQQAQERLDNLLHRYDNDLTHYAIPPNIGWQFQVTPTNKRVYHVTMYYKGIAIN